MLLYEWTREKHNILYTVDCRSSSDASLLINFADDALLTGLVDQEEAVSRGGVQEMVEWCDSNFLALNVSKTKKLVVDFRAAPTNTEPMTIKGQPVEMVSANRYLSIVIDNKLSWTPPQLTSATRKHKRKCTSCGSCNFSK